MEIYLINSTGAKNGKYHMGPRANPFVSGQCYEQFMIHMSLQVCFRASGRMLELSPYKHTRVLIKLDH